MLAVAGLGYFFMTKKSAAKTAVQESKEIKDTTPKELTEEEKKALADERNATLAKLVCPSNFPQDMEVPIYFGS